MSQTRVDKIINWFKDNKIISILIVLVIIYFGLGQIIETNKIIKEVFKNIFSPKQELHQKKEEVFKATIINTMQFKFPGPLLYFYNSKFGKTISPICIALYVEACNNKNILSKIYSYSLKILFRYDEGGELKEVEDKNGGRKFIYNPSGNVVEKWHSLHSVGTLHDQIYWVTNNDWTKCRRIDFSKNSFDVLAREKQLHPGESITGWMFFEIPYELRGQLPEIIEMELTLTNSQGETQTFRRKSPTINPESSVISCGVWHLLEGFYDLTKEHYTICPQTDLREILKQENIKAQEKP